MNKLILCEGKSDVVLLSYYLGKMCNWEVAKKGPAQLKVKYDEQCGEYGCWYRRGDDYLFICGVGGKDRFGSFFQTRLLHAITDSSSFTHIAFVTDRDDRDAEDIAAQLQSWLAPIEAAPLQNEWTSVDYQDGFGLRQELQLLMLIIPTDHEGALETVLMDAISEDPYDQKIVERSKQFVTEMEPIADRYLHKARLRLKAQLSVTWAIQSPEKEFHFIDEQIRAVPWECSETLKRCFASLLEL